MKKKNMNIRSGFRIWRFRVWVTFDRRMIGSTIALSFRLISRKVYNDLNMRKKFVRKL